LSSDVSLLEDRSPISSFSSYGDKSPTDLLLVETGNTFLDECDDISSEIRHDASLTDVNSSFLVDQVEQPHSCSGNQSILNDSDFKEMLIPIGANGEKICTVLYTNTDSMPNKKEELINLVSVLKPKIIGLTEILPKNQSILMKPTT
jgi:hypothetical protein